MTAPLGVTTDDFGNPTGWYDESGNPIDFEADPNAINGVSAPTANSSAEAMAEYIKSLPALYDAQMKYDPKLQQLYLDMMRQFAPQLMQEQLNLQQGFGDKFANEEYLLQSKYQPLYAALNKNINDSLYPYTSGLQEQLAEQATNGMKAELPEWMKKQYLSNLYSQLGTNAGSPIAANYASTGLLSQQKQFNDYYRDLGLSVAGRQPLTSATAANTAQIQAPQMQSTNYMQGYQPAQSLSYQQGNYATGMNAYTSMYGSLQGYNAAQVPLEIEQERQGTLGGALFGGGSII